MGTGCDTIASFKRGINLAAWLADYIYMYRVLATAQGFIKGGWRKVCDAITTLYWDAVLVML